MEQAREASPTIYGLYTEHTDGKFHADAMSFRTVQEAVDAGQGKHYIVVQMRPSGTVFHTLPNRLRVYQLFLAVKEGGS